MDKARKLELLTRADEAARAAGDAVTQVQAGCGDGRRRVLVANSDGPAGQDEQVRTRFSVSCVAIGDTGMQTGFESAGPHRGLRAVRASRVEEIARRGRGAGPGQAVGPPGAVGRGAGRPGRWAAAGILFHEACGHGLEADHIVKDASVYAGRVGELVASPLVTLVDDGTVAGEWGTSPSTTRATRPARNVLIENGVLTDYMWDWLRARKEGRVSSGNGRRQSYQHLPMVRMTNTFLLAGQDDPDEIVAQTPSGVYVAKLGGGQVNTTTGDFVFGTTEAYLIEDGRITEPLRDANLIGNGPEVLQRIDAVATDFAMTPGTCGKDGQSVPGRLRAGHAADHRRDHRGHGVSDRCCCDLAPLASWTQARPGEEIEVYVGRGTETEVRAYEGEVESLSSADSAGVGIRVVLEAPMGRAARSASPGPAPSTRTSWPRPWPTPATTPASPRPTRRGAGRARRRRAGGARPVGRGRGLPPRPRRRSSWPWSSSVRPRGRPPGPAGRRRPTTATAGGGGPGLDHRDLVVPRGGPRPSCRSTPSPGEGAEPDRDGVQRGPGPWRARSPTKAARRRRAARHRACSVRRRSRRAAAPWSSTPAWSRRCWPWSPRRCRARRWSRDAPSSPGGSASRWPPPR